MGRHSRNRGTRLATLATHIRGHSTIGTRCTRSTGDATAVSGTSYMHSNGPTVKPVVVHLKDSHRDVPLPGVGAATRQVTIRQLQSSDEAAYCAFGGRVTWREGWHYPLFGLPGSDEHFRRTAARQGQPRTEVDGGELRLVLVETRTEAYNGRVYSWEEIYGEGWYTWKHRTDVEQSNSQAENSSTFGLCVNADFQGTGAGRALITRVLEVAEETGYGPSIMKLTVQDINQRARELYESVGFEFEFDEQLPERELVNYPGRVIPPMRNRHYFRKLGGVYQQ